MRPLPKADKIKYLWKTNASSGQVMFFIREHRPGKRECTRRISKLAMTHLISQNTKLKLDKPTEKSKCRRNRKGHKISMTRTKLPIRASKVAAEFKIKRKLEQVAGKKTHRPRSKRRTKTKRAPSQPPKNNKAVKARKKMKAAEKKEKEKKTNEAAAVLHGFNRKLAEDLRDIYTEIYAFPLWAIEKVAFSKWWPLLHRARIHFHAYDDQQLVTQLATQREPVNIAGQRFYDQDALKREFGWKTGLYGRYYNEHKRLAPNIGVFTPAVVKVESKYKHIYVYNAIGIAFDHKNQPDYQYYFGKPKPKYSELLTQYKHIFQRVYECAETNKLSTVVMSLVGGDNFAKEYKPQQLTDKGKMESFRAEIWFPAFRIIRAKHKHISTIFMGTDRVRKEFKKEYGSDYIDIGRFPANTKEVDCEKTLFVNAWDPFSLPGNGNCHDNSLDGFMGCNTTIALTGSPMTNPFMSYQVHFKP